VQEARGEKGKKGNANVQGLCQEATCQGEKSTFLQEVGQSGRTKAECREVDQGGIAQWEGERRRK
jgi:hypothetical protein